MTWKDGDHFEVDDTNVVSHINGSSAQRGNWKQYWMEHTDKPWPSGPNSCKIHGCPNEAEVGAHVWIKKESGNITKQGFIIPTCSPCNTDGLHDFPNWVSVNQGTFAVRKEVHENMYVEE